MTTTRLPRFRDTPITFTEATSTTSATVQLPTQMKQGSATVQATSPVVGATTAGDVQVQVKNVNGVAVQTVTGTLDASGKTTVSLLPRVAGKYTLEASYPGSTVAKAPFTVAKNKAVLKGAWTRKPTGKRSGGIRISVLPQGIKATGVMTVTVKNAKGKVVRTIRKNVNASNFAAIPLPKLAKGNYTLTAKYAGNGRLHAGTYTLRFATIKG